MFTHLSKFKAVAVAAAALFTIGSAHAATYTDKFEKEDYGLGAFATSLTASSTTFGSWITSLGSVQLIDDNSGYPLGYQYSGTRNESLVFSGFSILTYSFTLGTASTVAFDIYDGADSSNAIAILLDGSTVKSHIGSISDFDHFNVGSYSLATGNHTLSFVSAQGTYYLDNFTVNVTAAPVPEPETYAMMLAGLGALGFMARRRRAS
jgi:hypothetical protein